MNEVGQGGGAVLDIYTYVCATRDDTKARAPHNNNGRAWRVMTGFVYFKPNQNITTVD